MLAPNGVAFVQLQHALPGCRARCGVWETWSGNHTRDVRRSPREVSPSARTLLGLAGDCPRAATTRLQPGDARAISAMARGERIRRSRTTISPGSTTGACVSGSSRPTPARAGLERTSRKPHPDAAADRGARRAGSYRRWRRSGPARARAIPGLHSTAALPRNRCGAVRVHCNSSSCSRRARRAFT
jgi:hypothetical protein